LLERGYEVFGLIRRSSVDNTWRIKGLNIELIQGDMTDSTSLLKAVEIVKPDEVYNLAAQSFVKTSWDSPVYTMNVNALGVARLLEAILKVNPKIRVYQASSSEMFGKVQETPQKEETKFYPRSIYGVSKASAHWTAVNYRESYGMFICCGICFNHESERRGLEFLSRKVTDGVARIKLGMEEGIELGNLDAKRDWGYAPEYTNAMWKMLQKEYPDDYVLATGESHSIREFVKEAFECVGIKNWKDYVKQNPKYVRKAEVDYLNGSSEKARLLLEWAPKVIFKDLVKIMVDADIERYQNLGG
jgi:GDPmannose 4,6-dehydratase